MAYKSKSDQAKCSRLWYLKNRMKALKRKADRLSVRKAKTLDHKLKFAEWQKAHLKRCKDFKGQACCKACHETDELYIIDMGEDVAYVCCLVRIKNKLGIEDEGQALHLAFNRHPVTPNPDESDYDAEAIAKLPPGLLRDYAEKLMLKKV